MSTPSAPLWPARARSRPGARPPRYPGLRGAARAFQPRDARLVRAHLLRADAGAGARLARDRDRQAHADPGADRLGQDARGLSLRDRQADPGARTGTPPPLRLAAEGAQLRHRAQPAWATRRAAVGADRRRPYRRHVAEGASADAPPPAGHPDHDAGVALPDADLAGSGDPPRCRDADPG